MKNFENYYCVGPYIENSIKNFEESKTPSKYKKISSELEKLGIKIYFGKWKTKSNPNVILVEHIGYKENINSIKAKLWEEFQIDSLGTSWYDIDDVLLWSWCC